ncbi:type I-E CRISPR-associated protein Cas6/Cse3/CasE [Cellulomonas iranensis]|uniref:type I-E CRISPR-associated protein Cas6/Cse3/CasE n=1 Tax=Cellulomonas iranensis TaxID=76862 RepID=UPI001CF38539|nr:type I-E CRISPR-associated protein Cas6/Cse3/CasE [Cellulomonas iranensis]UCN14952.1 type I-E CRISPR-associated protein Cas6/Cse3/CasE [Cellulomonas iranensis]
MYLSRIQLNPRRRDARRLLSSPQRLHAAVLAAFPEPPTGDRAGEARVLWRLDTETDGRVLLYVVSPDQPDLTHVAEQAGWPSTERGTSKEYGPFLDKLTEGQRWAFRLTANPTRYVQPEDGGRAKRVAHVSVPHQEDWLRHRAAAAGFTVWEAPLDGLGGHADAPVLRVTRRGTEQFARRGTEGAVTLAVAQFDGVLEVTDADALRRALVAGIGPAKAYGCGLLTLAPVG